MIREKSSILGSKSMIVDIPYLTLPTRKYNRGNRIGVVELKFGVG